MLMTFPRIDRRVLHLEHLVSTQPCYTHDAILTNLADHSTAQQVILWHLCMHGSWKSLCCCFCVRYLAAPVIEYFWRLKGCIRWNAA